MEIYLDLVFLENFLMDFILLLMVGKMIHKTICLPRLLAAAFLGGISAAVLCLLHPQFVLLQVCNLIAGLCMLLLSYPLKRLEYLPALLFLYGSAFVLEGMLRFLGRFIGSRGQHRLYFLLGTGLFGWLFFRCFCRSRSFGKESRSTAPDCWIQAMHSGSQRPENRS